MPIRVVELHHHGIRIGTKPGELEEVRKFYTEVLRVSLDSGRPEIPGIPGFWMDVGQGEKTTQIHLMSAVGMSPAARSEKEDPTRPHVALAVENIQEVGLELERRGICHWRMEGLVGTNSDQIFVQDPAGNLVELHQVGTCRCNKADR